MNNLYARKCISTFCKAEGFVRRTEIEHTRHNTIVEYTTVWSNSNYGPVKVKVVAGIRAMFFRKKSRPFSFRWLFYSISNKNNWHYTKLLSSSHVKQRSASSLNLKHIIIKLLSFRLIIYLVAEDFAKKEKISSLGGTSCRNLLSYFEERNIYLPWININDK